MTGLQPRLEALMGLGLQAGPIQKRIGVVLYGPRIAAQGRISCRQMIQDFCQFGGIEPLTVPALIQPQKVVQRL